MLDDIEPYRILDDAVYANYRHFSLNWLDFKFGIAPPTRTKGDDMAKSGQNRLWKGQGKQYQQLIRRLQTYLVRWEISPQKFAELAGLPMSCMDDLLNTKPKFRLLQEEYHAIFHQLNRPLEIQPSRFSQDVDYESVLNQVPTGWGLAGSPEIAQPAEDTDDVPEADDPEDTDDPSESESLDHSELKQQLTDFINGWGLTRRSVSRWAGYSSSYVSLFLSNRMTGSQDFVDRMLELLTHPEGLPFKLRQHSPVWQQGVRSLSTTPPGQPTQALEQEEPAPMPIPQENNKSKWVFITHQMVRTSFVIEANNFVEASRLWEKGIRGERLEPIDSLSAPEVVEVKRYDAPRDVK